MVSPHAICAALAAAMPDALPDSATPHHDAVEAVLRRDQWEVAREVGVAHRGDRSGYRGRVDIVATRLGTTLAIEIDSRNPRRKSLAKLRQVDADIRLVLLRCEAAPYWVGDVLVAGLGVSP